MRRVNGWPYPPPPGWKRSSILPWRIARLVQNMPTLTSSSVPAAYMNLFGRASMPPAKPHGPNFSPSPRSESTPSPWVRYQRRVTPRPPRDQPAPALSVSMR